MATGERRQDYSAGRDAGGEAGSGEAGEREEEGKTVIDQDKLAKHIADGVVNEQQHPSLPLRILNYSQRCQFDRLWDDITLQCRGLVMHGESIVARPFRKFFNDGEHADGEIPWHLPCEITEKLDGSLLIVFYFGGEWHFATRGSFISKQSQRGKLIFERQYGDVGLNPMLTYLFEVIYPENRIVVNYGDIEQVVLLAVIDPTTGSELPLPRDDPQFLCVRSLPPTASAKDLRSLIRDDEEGYVVRFENGFRIKVKGSRYMELHKLISGVSSRSVWEALSQGKPLDEMLAVIPDEFGDWVRKERTDLLAAFDHTNARVEQAYLTVKDFPSRKEQALCLLSQFVDVSSAAFLALDKKPVAPAIWKQLYPEFRRPEAAARIEA